MEVNISNGVYNESISEIMYEVGLPAKLTPTEYLQGIQGIQGLQGSNGYGMQGLQGMIGLHGHIGLQGPAGLPGYPSINGLDDNYLLGIERSAVVWKQMRSSLINQTSIKFTNTNEVTHTIKSDKSPFVYIVKTLNNNKYELINARIQYNYNGSLIYIVAELPEVCSGVMYLL